YVANDRDPGPGLYVALSCAYNFISTATAVTLLEGIGEFKARSSGCGNNVVQIAPHPILGNITDAYLSNWFCSTHDGFYAWPDTFIPLAIVTDAPNPNFTTSKGITGVVYMLVSATARNRWTTTVPGAFHEDWLDWSLDGAISPNDGLVLTNVTLGSRYMAKTI